MRTIFLLGICWSALGLAFDTATWEMVQKNDAALALGKEVAWLVDAQGVRCWGSNELGLLDMPPLSHPRQISLGDTMACAIDDGGVKCWGEVSRGKLSKELFVPELTE